MTDILAKLAALTIGDENCQLSERLRELANAIQVWDGETPAAKLLFDAADRLAYEAALIALVQEAAGEIERLRGCLGFFASVIKSGEPWTDTCQREYDKAINPLEPTP